MPELPEVETIRRDLEPWLLRRKLQRVTVRRRDLRFPLPRGFASAAKGAEITALKRRGKYLLFQFSNGRTLLCHLGMSGRILVEPLKHQTRAQKRERHEHLVFYFSPPEPNPAAPNHALKSAKNRRSKNEPPQNRARKSQTPQDQTTAVLRFADPRRFGFWDQMRSDELDAHPRLRHLGLEPLAPAFNGKTLHRLLRERRSDIKAALLDQKLVAGIGNIYACEALFQARINPWKKARDISRPAADRLAHALRQVLLAALAAGGSSQRDYLRAQGELGYFQTQWAVYGRAGEACPECRCNPARQGGVQTARQAGRSTFYCPRKQR